MCGYFLSKSIATLQSLFAKAKCNGIVRTRLYSQLLEALIKCHQMALILGMNLRRGQGSKQAKYYSISSSQLGATLI